MALKLTKNLNYLNFNGVNQQGSTAGLVLENTTFPRKVTFIFRIQSIPTNSQILFLNNGTGMAFGFVGNSIITTHTNQRLRFNTDLIQLNE